MDDAIILARATAHHNQVVIVLCNTKVSFKIIAPEVFDVLINKFTSGIIEFVCFFCIPIKINPSNYINPRLSQPTRHSAPSAEKVYRLELSIITIHSYSSFNFFKRNPFNPSKYQLFVL